jgi:hypothetical protein
LSREPLSPHGKVRTRTFSFDPASDRALVVLKRKLRAASLSELLRRIVLDRYHAEIAAKEKSR